MVNMLYSVTDKMHCIKINSYCLLYCYSLVHGNASWRTTALSWRGGLHAPVTQRTMLAGR
jgi:hypothetical protein